MWVKRKWSNRKFAKEATKEELKKGLHRHSIHQNVQIANCVKSHEKGGDTLKSNRLLLRPLVRDQPPYIAAVPQKSEHTRRLPKPCPWKASVRNLMKGSTHPRNQKVSSKAASIMGHLKFCNGTDGSLSQVCTRYSPITQWYIFRASRYYPTSTEITILSLQTMNSFFLGLFEPFHILALIQVHTFFDVLD